MLAALEWQSSRAVRMQRKSLRAWAAAALDMRRHRITARHAQVRRRGRTKEMTRPHQRDDAALSRTACHLLQ